MSYCKEEGKDKIIFLTPEDLQQPSSISFPEDEEPPGLILPNGEINWNCPCLGGMATGPCGVEFRDAFSCFHFSQAEMKGSDCYEAFKTMQECMAKYPTVYGSDKDDSGPGEDDEDGSQELVNPSSATKEQSEGGEVSKGSSS